MRLLAKNLGYQNYAKLNKQALSKLLLTSTSPTIKQNGKFIIYGSNTCPYCRKAKELLELYGLPYQFKDNPVDVRLAGQRHNMSTIPVVEYEGKKIGGFDDLKRSIVIKRNM